MRRHRKQQETLIGLKLNLIGRIAELPDTPQTRGMIAKVAHLVRIIAQEIPSSIVSSGRFGPSITSFIMTRIGRGEGLWAQFEAAVEACRADPRRRSSDHRKGQRDGRGQGTPRRRGITWPLTCEPDLLPDGRKIDFVVDRGADNLYIEVKTVRPHTADTAAAWQKFIARGRHHPDNVHFIVDKEWMGGAIYGNVFASRSHFLDYTMDFETRLAAAQAIKPGHGVLIFCGTGFAWHKSNLEDFADFYLTSTHRSDDAFALMEQHHIKQKKIKLLRNIGHFAFLRRHIEMPQKGRIPLSHPRPAPDPSTA